MDAVLRNILVRMCCCCRRLPANKYRQHPKTSKDFQIQHPKTSSTNIITLHNSLQVHEKFRVRKKVFIYFIFYVYLKRMGLNLSTNLPMFVYSFQSMWRHRPLKEYSGFVGISVACTSFSPYTLTTYNMVFFYREKIFFLQYIWDTAETTARVSNVFCFLIIYFLGFFETKQLGIKNILFRALSSNY